MGAIANIVAFRNAVKVAREAKYECGAETVQLPCTPSDLSRAEYYSAADVSRIADSADLAYYRFSECVVSVENADSLSCARSLLMSDCAADSPPPLVLNFANPRTPGGDVRAGASAQEEDLCRSSTLYSSLCSTSAREFYQANRQSDRRMHTNGVLVSPMVYVFKDSDGSPLRSPLPVAVISSPAPIARGVNDGEAIRQVMQARIKGLLSIAAHCGYSRLVLGAWGCGAFGNDPQLVAGEFAKALSLFGAFGERAAGKSLQPPFCRVVFAVLDKSSRQATFCAFKDVLG